MKGGTRRALDKAPRRRSERRRRRASLEHRGPDRPVPAPVHLNQTYSGLMGRGWTVGLWVALGALALAGCGGRARRVQHARSSAVLTARLRIYGTAPEAVALANLTLMGHHYVFVVDTGAARTVIRAPVAHTLGLRDDGPPQEFFPLGCRVSSQPVALSNWRLGNTSLRPIAAITQPLLAAYSFRHAQFGGLLGSDSLSRFGTATIDFTDRRLTLGGNPPTGGRAVPITVLRHAGAVLATTQVTVDNHRLRFLVDTGSASSLIDSAVADRLGLRTAGHSGTIAGAVCRRNATPIWVHRWSFAGLHRRNVTITRIRDLLPEGYVKHGIVGVLGTATLARLGTVTIDFTRSDMILGQSKR
jgi:predicted aspartyl protease